MRYPIVYRLGKIIVSLLFKIILPYTIRGREYIPEKGRLVICCNHISLKDPILVALPSKRQVFYMAKSELFKNKWVAKFIMHMGAFPVQRGEGDANALSAAEALLDKEKAVGIFLEGTRSKTGKLCRPKSGAVILAYQAKAPILPMCITTKGKKFIRFFHRVKISCGELIYPDQLGIEKKDGAEFRKASLYVMSKIAKLREEDLQSFVKKKRGSL